MRTVFLVDLRHGGEIPKVLRDVLDLMGWAALRPGLAYSLDWDEAIGAPYPGSVWDRIETVWRTSRQVGLTSRMLTMRRGEKIPVPTAASRLQELLS